MQYMRDQASIDDDPVAFLSVSIIFDRWCGKNKQG